jgi:glycosyltransferase involved in cell wall biosynthesis
VSVRIQVVVPYGRSNSSVRTRALHWLDRYAAESGAPVEALATVCGPGFAGRAAPSALPTLVVRNVHRFSRGRQEQRLLRAGAPGVYDLDDGLPWDNGHLPGLGHWWKRPWPRSLIAARAAAAADRVVVGNEVLAEWASTMCSDVRIVPTCVEPDSYTRKIDYSVPAVPVLGWVGSPATEHYLVGVAPALAEVHRRTGARVAMISGPGDVPAALAEFTDRVQWSEAVVADAVARWDVGLMPLADGVYERAKCGYKLLQYGSAGLPVVGTPIGVNERLLRDMDGLAPTTVDEWVDSLVEQLNEPTARRAERGAATRRVAEAHSYDTWESRWRDAVGLTAGAGE